ncbi:molecular chaperone [Lelliottia sp. V106_10]|uniref:fimbrial biogenesis chaperone n=1 Tax=Lelliottia wanjuensis TaxID=3050585 RepID=UPI00254D73FE|nr:MULTISPECIES: molecular chaperone [unclassified Lelliottia]MDK9358859.1 molecular chaperone [Lelliottia sp. V106_16]MDK9373546.1 molecular chaperone [Lelliottia sp. V106_10]MDK9600413.1 molecular chaperone [Lelliottia sp. V106_5]
MKKIQISEIFLLAVACLWGSIAQAGVVVGGTRVVYDGGEREAALSVKNPDKIPYLIQAWTDADGALGDKQGSPKPPFIVTPPLFRLDAGNENMVRIIRTGGNLPEDHESVYWMNVKSIPASASGQKNVLQISVKTRIKLFYRPESIKAPTIEDYKKVTFKRAGNQLQVINPTPYYLSIFSLKVGGMSVNTTNVMVPAKGTSNYPMPSGGLSNQVSWQAIGDYGGNSDVITSTLK